MSKRVYVFREIVKNLDLEGLPTNRQIAVSDETGSFTCYCLAEYTKRETGVFPIDIDEMTETLILMAEDSDPLSIMMHNAKIYGITIFSQFIYAEEFQKIYTRIKEKLIDAGEIEE